MKPTITDHTVMNRRTFLEVSGSCSAHMMLMTAGAPAAARRFASRRSQQQVVASEPWGRLERIGEGLWALISTPLDGDRTTLCNGGIIAGSNGAMIVESFASADGAAWMARMTRELTGRSPTHAVLTHYHGDHANGFQEYGSWEEPADLLARAAMRDLIRGADARR